MEDVLVASGRNRRANSGDVCEQFAVFCGVGLARFLPVQKMAEFYAKDGGLNFVEAAVPTRLGADITRSLAVIAQRAQARIEFGGVCDDHSAVAGGAEIFCRIKTDARDVAERAGAAAFVGGADGLRVVFNQGNAAFGGDRAE